ncbi:MAG: cysteine synthase A [Bacteroidota bacterium]
MIREKIITDFIGNTPVVQLGFLNDKLYGKIFVKLENKNPGGSVKDRLALALIEDGEKRNLINKDTTIIEASSGNTGIGLAMICASKSYRLILVMPESVSEERKHIIEAYGAEIVLTSSNEGMNGSVIKSTELHSTIKNSYLTCQFDNPANPLMHKKTTAVEIWKDMNSNIDIFICGTGTGGTITGVGEYLKSKNRNISIIAIEPENSPVLSGGKAGFHKIQGIGPGFIPSILNTRIIDEIIKVKDDEAIETTRRLAREEGILCGISSGANVFGALKIAEKLENKNKNILTIICDTGERYLSTNIFI